MKRILVRVLTLFLFIPLTGCGDGKGTVQGTVTFDGQPVADGAITFVKKDGKLVREGAVIRDGNFQARMPPGQYKIEVNGQKVVGKTKERGKDGALEEVDMMEELFPERYNTKTELTEEIKSGRNTIKLDLQSEK